MQFFKTFITGAVCLALLDLAWMGVVAGSWYRSRLGSLLRSGKEMLAPQWFAVGVLYLALSAGIVYFVLPHAQTVGQAALWGALFGLIVYGVYELTNYALLLHWPVSVVLVDTLWGGVICALASMCVYWIQHRGA